MKKKAKLKFQLNDSQLDRLSEFTANLGLVFFASAVTPLFSSVDKADPFMIGSGLAGMIVCLAVSLLLLKGAKR